MFLCVSAFVSLPLLIIVDVLVAVKFVQTNNFPPENALRLGSVCCRILALVQIKLFGLELVTLSDVINIIIYARIASHFALHKYNYNDK